MVDICKVVLCEIGINILWIVNGEVVFIVLSCCFFEWVLKYIFICCILFFLFIIFVVIVKKFGEICWIINVLILLIFEILYFNIVIFNDKFWFCGELM